MYISDDQLNASASTKAAMYRLLMASVQPRDLTGFVELAYSIRHYCLPDLELIPVSSLCVCSMQCVWVGGWVVYIHVCGMRVSRAHVCIHTSVCVCGCV